MLTWSSFFNLYTSWRSGDESLSCTKYNVGIDGYDNLSTKKFKIKDWFIYLVRLPPSLLLHHPVQNENNSKLNSFKACLIYVSSLCYNWNNWWKYKLTIFGDYIYKLYIILFDVHWPVFCRLCCFVGK